LRENIFVMANERKTEQYDVLAIAVSGETQQQLKDERKATPIFGDNFLPAQDYLNGIKLAA